MKRERIDWEALDWSQQDTALAKLVGRSRQRVHQVRKNLRQRRAENHGKDTRPRKPTPAQQRITSWLAKNNPSDFTVAEAAAATRVNRTTIEAHAKQHDLTYRHATTPKYAWHTITPQMWENSSNIMIARQLGTGAQVVASYRYTKHKPKYQPTPKHHAIIRKAATLNSVFTLRNYQDAHGESISRRTLETLRTKNYFEELGTAASRGTPLIYRLTPKAHQLISKTTATAKALQTKPRTPTRPNPTYPHAHAP